MVQCVWGEGGRGEGGRGEREQGREVQTDRQIERINLNKQYNRRTMSPLFQSRNSTPAIVQCVISYHKWEKLQTCRWLDMVLRMVP